MSIEGVKRVVVVIRVKLPLPKELDRFLMFLKRVLPEYVLINDRDGEVLAERHLLKDTLMKNYLSGVEEDSITVHIYPSTTYDDIQRELGEMPVPVLRRSNPWEPDEVRLLSQLQKVLPEYHLVDWGGEVIEKKHAIKEYLARANTPETLDFDDMVILR